MVNEAWWCTAWMTVHIVGLVWAVHNSNGPGATNIGERCRTGGLPGADDKGRERIQ
eukprot:NODE_2246_length_1167_cov_8.026834_g1863_i0.p5 GENE.NODE_2246_length_1167_cov_8.026834_g1863_i0~~NODE_2246_length_1167_cov_8.026834_g1863_i0.p5  ORF type:complete len:56 (-),score=4.17 NODE_2246_length_1167_cov_8.026834_g1863_i0:438-605(-)